MLNSMPISICICTYQRPTTLEILLRSLAMVRALHQVKEIIVVDNDPAESASPVVECIAPAISPDLIYVVEPLRGISHARNRALQEASGKLIAFFDDDQFILPWWIESACNTMDRSHADVVLGPVRPLFLGAPIPTWAVSFGHFCRPDHQEGEYLTYGRTGNVLLQRHILDHLDLPYFDPALANTGGEDGDFFRRIRQKGFSIVWSSDAVVFECIPPSRMRLSWAIWRSCRGGQNWAASRVNRRVDTRMKLFTRGLVGMANGLLLMTLTPLGCAYGWRGFFRLVASAGVLWGCFHGSAKVY